MLLRPRALLLRALAGGQRSRAARYPLESARPIFGGLLWHCSVRPVHRTQLRRGDAPFARGGPAAGDFVGAHRVLTAAAGMAGEKAAAKVALLELRRAQPNITLAWIATQMPIMRDADREHYLEGFRRAGLD